MSDIIGFLVRMGESGQHLATVLPASPAGDLPQDVRAAFLTGDTFAVARLASTRTSMVCAISAPDNDEPQPDERDQPADSPDDAESQAA